MRKIKIVVAGDLHGNIDAAESAVFFASRHGSKTIVQCGDFGLWPGYQGMQYLDMLNQTLSDYNTNLIWVDGNHEDFDQLSWYVKNNPVSKNGHVYIRSNILYSPRGHVWTWDNKNFMSVGGAVSVDKQWRVPKKSWWPQEQLTETQAIMIGNDIVRRRRAGKGEIDYLFTHDCSNKTEFKNRLKPDIESEMHRRRIDRVLEAVRPRIHFHGHFHETYEWDNWLGYDEHLVRTYGLSRDGDVDNVGILDTKTDSFTFASQL